MIVKKIIAFLCCIVSANAFAYVYATATTYEVIGKINEDIKIASHHSVSIINNELIMRQYYYHYTLKVDEKIVASYNKTLELMRNSNFNESNFPLTAIINKNKSGKYIITAETRIISKENTIKTSTNKALISE